MRNLPVHGNIAWWPYVLGRAIQWNCVFAGRLIAEWKTQQESLSKTSRGADKTSLSQKRCIVESLFRLEVASNCRTLFVSLSKFSFASLLRAGFKPKGLRFAEVNHKLSVRQALKPPKTKSASVTELQFEASELSSCGNECFIYKTLCRSSLNKTWRRPSLLPNYLALHSLPPPWITPPRGASTSVYLKCGREPLDVGNWCFVSALQGRHGTVVHDGGLLCALGQVLEGSQTRRLSPRHC